MRRFIDSEFLPNVREVEVLIREHEKRYTPEMLRERGKVDGEAGIPASDSEQPSPFEEELKHEVAGVASRIATIFRSSLEIIDAKIRAEESFVEREYLSAQENIKELHTIDNEAAENAFGLTDAHRRLEQADSRVSKMYEEVGRGPVIYIPHWLYIVFATLIFLGEIPLNALVFQIFGESQIMTWVMAFIIGLAVPLVAHFIGIKMREHHGGFSWPNGLKAFGAFACITIALYGLSLMRRTYLGEFQGELGLTSSLVDSSILFFWLNMAVFCAAIVVAYLSHDAIPGYSDAEYVSKKARKEVAKRERRRVKLFVRTSKRRAAALNKANKEYRDGLVRVTMMKGVYDRVLKQGQEFEHRTLQILSKELAIYRHENVRHRKGGETPPCFQKKLEFPMKLDEIPEKLINTGDTTHEMASA